MKKICLILCLILASCCRICDEIKPNPIIPNQTIITHVRVIYENNLMNKQQTVNWLKEGFEDFEQETGIKIIPVEEGIFTLDKNDGIARIGKESPEIMLTPFGEFLMNALVDSKIRQCLDRSAQMSSPNDGVFTLCVFNDVLTPPPFNVAGTVLGATIPGRVVTLANLQKKEFFINVLRHEVGHLFGAPHDEDGLMKPYVSVKAKHCLIPFSKASIEKMRKWIFRNSNIPLHN